jgi:hypothetical protein
MFFNRFIYSNKTIVMPRRVLRIDILIIKKQP